MVCVWRVEFLPFYNSTQAQGLCRLAGLRHPRAGCSQTLPRPQLQVGWPERAWQAWLPLCLLGAAWLCGPGEPRSLSISLFPSFL